MRFPRNLAQIDINRSEQLVIKAVQDGINYFDTAYVYGGSENVLGPILANNNLRSKIFLATKLPIARCNSYGDFELFFQEQLKRLRTDYIDYYLMHNLGDVNLWEALCKMNIEKWIKEKKESGQIKNTGFSFHGIHDEFMKLLDVYDWDFCQIQYNYLNTNYQAGTEGLKKAAGKGLSVIIMEPLLGGKLANGLPKKAVGIFKTADNAAHNSANRASYSSVLSPAAWALRWLWNQKEVTVVLSGMNEISQLDENIETAKDAVPDMLTTAQAGTYESVIKIISDSYKVPCTGCNYCMPCPRNVNIPACFTAYNVSYTVGFVSGILQYITSTGSMDPRKNYSASQCGECGACEKKCPQHIPIIKSLKKTAKRMEPNWVKAAVRIFLKLRG
jgi:predicted aldo/keto reductase-like oxidoreductase